MALKRLYDALTISASTASRPIFCLDDTKEADDLSKRFSGSEVMNHLKAECNHDDVSLFLQYTPVMCKQILF